MGGCMFCFFKQKTAYERRISDWSSDVCSSDLLLSEDALCLLFRKPELGLQAVDLRQFIVRDDLVGQRLLDRPPELPAFCECKHAPSLLLLRCRQTQNNDRKSVV